MKYIIDILKQPSSYAGLAAIAASFGIAQEEWAHISAVGAAVFGALAFFINSRHRA